MESGRCAVVKTHLALSWHLLGGFTPPASALTGRTSIHRHESVRTLPYEQQESAHLLAYQSHYLRVGKHAAHVSIVATCKQCISTRAIRTSNKLHLHPQCHIIPLFNCTHNVVTETKSYNIQRDASFFPKQRQRDSTWAPPVLRTKILKNYVSQVRTSVLGSIGKDVLVERRIDKIEKTHAY